MLTVRPLKENGEWANKTEKEYLCIRDGEERGFTAAEFKEAKLQGWEKQYPYFSGNKKVYLTATEGEDHHLKRASKYPKCTKFGRQNPISERWNSEDFLQSCRAAWADIVNQQLECNFMDVRIDHRSNAERGMDEKPTIHEGVIARALERKGILSEHCELNRQIKVDNNLLRELKAEVKHLEKMARGDAAFLAEALKKNKSMMIIARYQTIFNARQLSEMNQTLDEMLPILRDYHGVMKEVEKKMDSIRSTIGQVEHRQHVLAGQEEELLQKHAKLLARVTQENAAPVAVEQEKLQHTQQDAMQKKLMDTYGSHHDRGILNHAIRIADEGIR